MFKKSIKLFSSKSQMPGPVQEILDMPVSNKIKNAFKSNENVLKQVEVPYELRGEYLPRRPINPFKRRPLKVQYDPSHYMGFVLPSRRDYIHGMFDQEELFGIKRYRNDSPFIKEYSKIDDQICILILIIAWVSVLFKLNLFEEERKARADFYMNDMGVFCADDLL